MLYFEKANGTKGIQKKKGKNNLQAKQFNYLKSENTQKAGKVEIQSNC